MAKKKVFEAPVAPEFRDRIKELRRVRASELVPNDKNWRTHPKAQSDALKGVLGEIGYSSAVVAYEMEDGRLKIIDGHLRAETTPDMEVPVLVLDVTEQEADLLLATFDPLRSMSTTDKDLLGSLLETVSVSDASVSDLLASLSKDLVVEPPAEPAAESAALAETPVEPPALTGENVCMVLCPGCSAEILVDAAELIKEASSIEAGEPTEAKNAAG